MYKDNTDNKISRMEKERDDLIDLMFDHPEYCNERNIRHLNYLETQIEILSGNKVYNVNLNDY